MGVLKVENGTPRSDFKTLCGSCRNSMVVKGRDLQYLVYCTDLSKEIRFSVTECSWYADKRQPSLYDLRSIAWTVETRGKRGPAGFVDGVKVDGGEIREVTITPPKKKKDDEDDY